MKKNLEKLIKEGKHFCILPWVHFHAWPTGKILPCCVADSNLPVSEFDSSKSILDVMNSDEYKKMRLDMLKDKPVDACKRCYELEYIGVWTLRESQNTVRGLNSIDLVKNTNKDGSINEFKMKYMDIRFTNLCNMKCRTCGPECSSLHAQEFVEKRKDREALFGYFKMASTMITINKNDDFFKKLKPHLKDVDEVYFAGGEALITKEHYKCLEFWINEGLQDKVELTYTTNFQVLKYKDKDLISLWKQFPKIKIWASLDDQGDRAELIRKGTDWNKIIENIKLIKKEVPHIQFQITPTISIYNVFSFPYFIDKLVEEKLIDEHIPARFNLLTNPWWANVQILPDYIKDTLIRLYQKYEQKYSYNSTIGHGFKAVEHNLKIGHRRYGDHISRENKEGIQEFIEYNNEIDSIRNESILDVIPELKEVYKWATN